MFDLIIDRVDQSLSCVQFNCDRRKLKAMATPGRKPRVLLAASGSVATVKVPELAVRFSERAEVPCGLPDSTRYQ